MAPNHQIHGFPPPADLTELNLQMIEDDLEMDRNLDDDDEEDDGDAE